MASSSIASDANFPPPSVLANFLPFTRTQISAPACLVFELLTDTTTWPQWNTYVPRVDAIERAAGWKPQVERVDSGAAGSQVDPPTGMKRGDTFRFFASLPGGTVSAKRFDASSAIVIDEVFTPDLVKGNTYRVVWSCIPSPLRPPCKQWHEVEIVSDCECEFRSYEAFTGIRARLVKVTFGSAIQKGMNERADGLKRIAEERWRERLP